MFRRLLPALAALVVIAPMSALAAEPPPAAPSPAPTLVVGPNKAGTPLAAYTHLPSLSQVRLSPDGTKIAYIVLVGETRRIGIQTMDGKPLATLGLGTKKVRDIRWGDDGHLLITTAYYGDLKGMSAVKSDYYIAQSYNVATQKYATLPGTGNTTGSAQGNTANNAPWLQVVLGAPIVRLVDGKRTTFVRSLNVSHESQYYAVDLDTGEATPRDHAGNVMDATGYWIASDESHENNANNTFSWRLVKRDGAGAKELWKEDGFVIEAPDLLGKGRSDSSVIVGYPVGDGQELWEVQLADGSRKKLKIADLGDNAGPFYEGLTGRLLGFEGLVENDYSVYWLDADKQAAWDSILATFPNEDVRLVSATPDYRKFVVSMTSNSDSGTYMFVDLDAKKVVKVGAAYADLKPTDVATTQYIHYKAADGTIIPAYLTLPNGRDPKNLPLIVLPHGGPGARDEGGFDWFAQPVASRGYAVLQPEYRGSTGYGKAHLEAGYGEWGRKMQTDLSDGVRYLASQGTIDPKRVCIFGWSYGGYAAMAGPAIDPGIYRCAVAGAGVSDLNKMLAWEKDRSSKDSIVVRFWKRFMFGSRPQTESLDAVSPARQAANVQVPMLLIHGKQDYTVPVEQSQDYADALRRAGKDVTLVVLPNDDHYIDARNASRQQVFDLAIQFLEKHNPPY
jgi:dipeptidyl aminopeptidase/acylaminoacyl peptidase